MVITSIGDPLDTTQKQQSDATSLRLLIKINSHILLIMSGQKYLCSLFLFSRIEVWGVLRDVSNRWYSISGCIQAEAHAFSMRELLDGHHYSLTARVVFFPFRDQIGCDCARIDGMIRLLPTIKLQHLATIISTDNNYGKIGMRQIYKIPSRCARLCYISWVRPQ